MRISIVLEALTGSFDTDVQRSRRRLNREMRQMRRDAERHVRRVGALVAGAAALATASTVAIVRANAALIDELGKTADALDISTESLQALYLLGELSGVSTEKLTTNLGRMMRRLGQVARNGGPAARALEDIGINIEDIINLSADQQLEVLARALADVENATIRASVANDLFGRDGLRMLKLLDELASQGLDPLRGKLDRLGFSLDREATRAVENMNDSLTTMRLISRGVGQTLTVELAPYIDAVASSLTTAAEESEGFETEIRSAVSAAAEGFASFLDATATATEAIEKMPYTARYGLMGLAIFGRRRPAALAAAIGAVFDLFDWFDFSFDWFDFDEMKVKALENSLERNKNILADVMRIEADPGFWDRALRLVGLGYSSEEIERRIEDIKRKLVEAREQLESSGDDDLFVLDLGGDVNAESDAPGVLRRMAAAIRQVRPEAEAAKAAIDDVIGGPDGEGMVLIDPAMLAEGQRMLDRTRTSAERIQAQIERVMELQEAGVFEAMGANGVEVMERLQAELAKLQDETNEMSEFARQAARNIQTAFADFLFDPFDEGLKGMLRSFADTLRRMAAEAASQQILGDLVDWMARSGNPILSGLGKVFGGGRASGGPISAGRPYLVGEEGPELIVPGAAGTVVPNHAMGGVNQTINIPLAFPPELEAYVRNVAGPAGRDAAMQIMRAQGGRI